MTTTHTIELRDVVKVYGSGPAGVRALDRVRDEDASGSAVAVTATPPAPHAHRSLEAFVDVPAGRSATPDRETLEAVAAHSVLAETIGEPFAWADDELRNKLTATYVSVGVILIVAAIVASTAFAVGARRQLRTLGQLSASGAPPAGLRRAVLLQGTVTGAVASGLGAALGLAGAAAARPFLADAMDRTLPPLRIHALDLALPVTLGILAATAAAWMPARSASRVPVLAALAGRRPAGRVPAAVPLGGAAAVGAGTAVLALWVRLDDRPCGIGLAAALVVLLGGTALAPWVVSLAEPLAARLRGGAKVAARGLARHRLRSAAVVAAVMAPAGLSVVAASAAQTSDARDRARAAGNAEDRLADEEVLVTHPGAADDAVAGVLADVREAVPDADELPVYIAVPHAAADAPATAVPISLEITDPAEADPDGGAFSSRPLLVASAEGFRTLGVPEATVDALEARKVVVFDRVSPDASLSRTDPGGATHPLDRRDIAADPSTRMPRGDQVAFVSEQTAASWGAAPVRYGTLFVAPDGLTETQARTVRAATDHDPDEWLRRYLTDPEAAPGGVSAEIGGEYADSPPSDGALLGWAAAGASLVFTLLVVAVALALDASESADERALLAAIGAPPSVRR